MDKDTATVVILGLGFFASLAVIVFFLAKKTSYVSFTRDSEGRIIEIVERVL